MDESLRAQIDIYLPHLDVLIRRGRQLRDALASDPFSEATLAATRAWQQDCGITVNELSGGSKAHWLARSFSEAFLLRSRAGLAVEGAAPAEIVDRVVEILKQAVASLSRMDDDHANSASPVAAPVPRRFEFVHDPELRPVLEQAYSDSRRALEHGRYDLALLTTCGILEAVVTDALVYKGPSALVAAGMPAGTITDWSFEARLAVAERAGLIHGGCARLPPVAWRYRDITEAGGETGADATVSERDARLAGQVLHVVIRDLDPGR